MIGLAILLLCLNISEEVADQTTYFKIVDEFGVVGGSSGLLLYNGGTVCNNAFNRNAADAICSLLGYEASGSEWTSGSRWNIQHRYSITLDDVNCWSSSWSSCTYSESYHDCSHTEDVFLTCTSRKEEGPRERRDSSCFTANLRTSGPVLKKVSYSSDQACEELCIATVGCKAVVTSPMSRAKTKCFIIGDYTLTENDANGWHTAERECFDKDSDQFNIVNRSGSDGGSSGLLLYNGGTVCDDYFGQYAANAICSLLGYKASGSKWTSGSRWDIQEGYSVTLNNVDCWSSSWSNCTYWESPECSHTEDVFLTCNSREDSDLFIMVDKNGSDGGSSGLLLYNGGTVCDDNFNQNAANAICSLLGYKDSGPKWTSGLRWDFQYEYSITLGDVTCYSNSWSRCTYRYGSGYQNCSHTEDIFLTCISQQEGILIGNNILYIILAAVPLCVGIFVGAFLYRKHKRNQRRSSREFQMVHTGENATIPSAPVPQTADNVQEGPGTEAAVSIPALGASNHAPPTYRETVNEYFEERVPTYEDVMADKNI